MSHQHSPESTRAIVNRISRAVGHFEAVKKMVEEGRDCSEILIQLAAVKAALNNIGKIILQDHISHCVVEAARAGDHKVLDDLSSALDKFLK